MLWVGTLGVILIATTVVAQPTLFVVMPNLMRFDSLEKVILEYSGGGNPINVKITLQNYPDRAKTFSIKNTIMQRDTQEIVRVEAKLTDMPTESLAQRNYIYVKVECAALSFSKETVVLLTGNKGYLFLQTDKPLYAPKQEVSIRAVSLNPEMLPANTEFALDILNPNGTIFEHFEGQAQKGFFSKKIKLPDITILGMWTVKAVYKNKFQSDAHTSSVQFEVREYVLPTFKVSIKTPDYIRRSNNAIPITVKAEFVYKEQVKGRMSIVYTLKKKDGSTSTVTMRTFSDFDGEMILDLQRADFGNRWFPDVGTRLVVDATVTEEASGSQEMATDESAVFVDSPYIVSFERTTKYFKPALPYNLKLDIKYASGNVAANIPMEVTASARVTGRANREEVFRDDANDAGFISDEEGRKSFTLDLPANAEDLKISVKTTDPALTDAEQASKEITLTPHHTASKNFLSIQIAGNPNRIPVGRKVEVRVDFTEDGAKVVTFMVLARGMVVSLTSVAVDGQSKHENIDVTAQMSPQARLVVYYISKGSPNEVIADSLVLDVSKTCAEELVLSHGQPDQSYRPGENVRFKIKSAEDSMVSLLAVDRAVYLRGGERDLLTRDKMFRKIMDLDLGCGPGSGKNAGEVFSDAGLNILSNQVDITESLRLSAECPAQRSRKRRSAERLRRSIQSNRMINTLMKYNDQDKVCCEDGISEQAQQQVVNGSTCDVVAQSKRLTHTSCKNAFIYCCQLERNASMPTGRSSGNDLEEFNEDDLADVPVRDDFPETWFSELFEMEADEQEMTRDLPDSITTWVVSGVSVSDAGMCVARPIDVTAKLDFFIHVDLPYAAVRGEQLEVKAIVYNFGRRQIRAHVWLSGDRSKLCFTGNSNDRTHKLLVTLPAKSGKKVTFPVVPLTIGEPEITVKALTAFSSGDIIIKKLLVRAEGVRRVATVSTRLDPEGIMGDAGTGRGNVKINIDRPNKRQTIEIPLSFPADAIPGTKICRAAISGSLLGQFVPTDRVDLNLGSKIALPTGCGEQTMYQMGPLVYTTRFMLDTNALTGALEQTAYRHILSGFQRELTYKHPDGSYAAYQWKTSSAWLTAFVAKVFCQASQFPNIGEKVAPHAIDAINWLITHAQKNDGHFWEPKSVGAGTYLFGQNLKNDVTFTAFVVEAISRCGAVNGIDVTSGNIGNKLRLAVNYLNERRDTQNKPYEQAILTYALAVQNSPHKNAANQKLRSMSSIDPSTGMRYWTPDGTVVPGNTIPVWYKTRPSAYAVETASYALLAQLEIGGATESYFQYAGPIASWLIRQRKVTGVFVSTTDTVIALEALTRYAQRASTRTQLNMNVRVFSGGNMLNTNIRLNQANAFAPQTIEKNLPIDGTLNIEATGSGLGEVQVECQYNSPELKGEICTFKMEVTSQEGNVPVEELNNEIEELEEARAQGNGGNRGDIGVETNMYVTEIKAEFSYIGAGDKVGMSILDVTLFTGFRAVDRDLINLKREGIIDRYEKTSSSVLMYLPEVKKNSKTTITFRAKQVVIVKDVQPAAITIYDYYEPDQHYCTKYYHPKQGSPLLATICDKDDEGRQVCQCAASACTDFWGFKRGQRPHVKTKPELLIAVCSIYEYAVKIRTGPVVVNGSLSKMEATVELNIKSGSQVYSTNDKINFVWNSKCENPEMKPATSYLVMGKDGARYVDANGRGAMRYVLDSSSYVVEWYGPRARPRYHRALETFGREMVQDGCGL